MSNLSAVDERPDLEPRRVDHARLAEGLHRLQTAMDELASLQPQRLDHDHLREGLRTVQSAVDRLEAIRAGWLVAFEAAEAYQADGTGSTQAWLRDNCRVSWKQAAGQVEMARQLQTLPRTRAAFEAGEIGERHARVIAQSVNDASLQTTDAEERLVEAARSMDPQLLGPGGPTHADRERPRRCQRPSRPAVRPPAPGCDSAPRRHGRCRGTARPRRGRGAAHRPRRPHAARAG